MDRSCKIVYLATENNAKSCLGLKEILRDGWNVKLVIAYSAPHQPSSISLDRLFDSIVHRFSLILYRMIFPQKEVNLSFKMMKELCVTYGIPYEPITAPSLEPLKNMIASITPDAIVSNGWMFKIPEDIVSLANIIAVNCHSSYLPEYRGGNITYAPLINEEKQSGVTVHQILQRFDAGLILAQERVMIDRDETPESLNAKRARITGKTLIRALETAGHSEHYKPNPSSPFYFRCSYNTYVRIRIINSLRKLLGLSIKRIEPKERYDI